MKKKKNKYNHINRPVLVVLVCGGGVLVPVSSC